MGVIYLRTNIVNGMQYVGQTKDLTKREYSWKSLKCKYGNPLLSNDREKYGLDNFTLDILKECDDVELNEWEKHYIKEFNTIYPNGYNENEGGRLGFHHSERTREKISKTKIGDKNPMYKKEPWNKGLTLSEEIKKKISDSHMGNTSALGHVLSDAAKEKISKQKKGVPNTKLAKPLIQEKPNGEIVEWSSVRECKDNGYYGVDRVCRGERPRAYECKWYYKTDYEKMLGEQNS
jgi:group I intron endonuclease